MSFRVIPPVDIGDSKLVSSSIVEPDVGEVMWTLGASFNKGARVYHPSNHKIYESVYATANTGHDPLNDPQDDDTNPPTYWLDTKEKTNRWRMFDLLRNQQSVAVSPMLIQIQPGQRIDSIGLFGMEAERVTIKMVNAGIDVYEYSENLDLREVSDWSDYFFLPFSYKSSLVLFDLPPYSDGVVIVELTSSTGIVKLGSLVVGSNVNLGDVQYGAESDVTNFSRIDRAFDGTSLLKQRRSVPKTSQEVLAPKARTNAIRKVRTDLNAVPAVWAGIDQTDDPYFEALLILGIYKKFSINISHPEVTRISLELEEV